MLHSNKYTATEVKQTRKTLQDMQHNLVAIAVKLLGVQQTKKPEHRDSHDMSTLPYKVM